MTKFPGKGIGLELSSADFSPFVLSKLAEEESR